MPNEYDERMYALRRDASYDTSKDRFSQPITREVQEDVATQPVVREPSTFDNLTDAEKKQLRDEWLTRQEAERTQAAE